MWNHEEKKIQKDRERGRDDEGANNDADDDEDANNDADDNER